MTTLVPGALLAAGAAIANLGFSPMADSGAAVIDALGFTPGAALGFTPMANTSAAVVAALTYTPANNAGETFTGPTRHTAAHTTPVAVTFSATAMAVNCALSNVYTTTLTANVTAAPTFSNLKDGQTLNWFLTQDGVGSKTMTWPTSFKWPGGTAGVLSTAANAVDLLVITYRAATGFWYASLLKDFK